MTMVNVEPQPRVDTLVRVPGGGERRRTEYLGHAWLDGKPVISGMSLLPGPDGPKGLRMPEKNVSFFLPDSLPYQRDRLADAQLSVTVSLRGKSGEHAVLLEALAAYVDDPSGHPTWVNLRVLAYGSWPFAFSYRVVALTAPDAAG